MTLTAENFTLPLVFGAGMLGSSHCLGMCGAISVSMSSGAKNLRESLLRQAAWSFGRTFTYAFLGLFAAAMGRKLMSTSSAAGTWQAWLAIIAGVLMVGQGLHTVGWLRLPMSNRKSNGCATTSILRQFLQGGSVIGAFVAGLVTGFLPCGLVYSFLFLAASTGNLASGTLIMAVFGAGTTPIMLATGAGFSLVSWSVRRRMLNLAAWCVLIAGAATLTRGVAFAVRPAADAPENCPLCSPDSSSNQPVPKNPE